MCGINLIIDKTKRLQTSVIEKMAETTRYRGPDEMRLQVIQTQHANYLMAVNRLMITDQTDSASQPMISADKKYALLFNGEIYNYAILKNELLDRGISFNTFSDTEVLFKWLIIHGKDGIDVLEGMFAFVFIVFEKDEVVAARDRFGIKPLHYFMDEKYAIFSSEIKPLVNSGLVEKKLDGPQIRHYLAWKYVQSPGTFYENIFTLEHGKAITLSHEKKAIFSYGKKAENEECKGASDPDKAEALLTESLLRQIDAKVPLGLLLSGGVDSTLLLALAHKEGFTLPTFSIINSAKDAGYGTEDYKFSRLAASAYRSDHHEMEVDISVLDGFFEHIKFMDQPIGDSAWLLTSVISENASKSMKILLSGAGADELFAGYNRHWAFYQYLKHRKLFDTLHPFVKTFTKALPSSLPPPLANRIRLMKKWANSHDRDPWRTWINYLTFNELNIELNSGGKNGGISDWFTIALNHDRDNYLVNDVLALSDRASMRHGIELRVPYLDDNLRQYLMSFDQIRLIERGRKWLLKEILKKYGGKKFVDRRKEGFGLPLGRWLFDKRAENLWGPLNSRESIIYEFIEKPWLDRLTDQHKRRREDHGPLLWSVIVLAHWLEQNFG